MMAAYMIDHPRRYAATLITGNRTIKSPARRYFVLHQLKDVVLSALLQSEPHHI